MSHVGRPNVGGLLDFDRNYNKWFAGAVLRAIRRHDMMREGDRIAVALSGGKDSVFLLWVLAYLRRYVGLGVDLSALHVRMGNYDTEPLVSLCRRLEVPYLEARLPEGELDSCYLCARLRRGAISEALRPTGVEAVAYGHHADDVAETFFMNLVETRRLGSFAPRLEAPTGGHAIIRPLVYLDEATIAAVHRHKGLALLPFTCARSDHTRRAQYKARVRALSEVFGVRNISSFVVAALENPHEDGLWFHSSRD